METHTPFKTRQGCLVKSQFPRCKLDQDEKDCDHLVVMERSPELDKLVNPSNLHPIGAQAYLKIILTQNMPGIFFDVAIGENTIGVNMDARAFEPFTAQQEGPAQESYTKFFVRVMAAIRAARAEYGRTHGSDDDPE